MLYYKRVKKKKRLDKQQNQFFNQVQQDRLICLILQPNVTLDDVYQLICFMKSIKETREWARSWETFAVHLHQDSLFDVLFVLLHSNAKLRPHVLLGELIYVTDKYNMRLISWCVDHVTFEGLYESRFFFREPRPTRIFPMLRLNINPLWFYAGKNQEYRQVESMFLNWNLRTYLGIQFVEGAIALLLCVKHLNIYLCKDVKQIILRAFAVAEFFRMKGEYQLRFSRFQLEARLDRVQSVALRPNSIEEFAEFYVNEISMWKLYRYPLKQCVNK